MANTKVWTDNTLRTGKMCRSSQGDLYYKSGGDLLFHKVSLAVSGAAGRCEAYPAEPDRNGIGDSKNIDDNLLFLKKKTRSSERVF